MALVVDVIRTEEFMGDKTVKEDRIAEVAMEVIKLLLMKTSGPLESAAAIHLAMAGLATACEEMGMSSKRFFKNADQGKELAESMSPITIAKWQPNKPV
jgi:hypothetical protein